MTIVSKDCAWVRTQIPLTTPALLRLRRMALQRLWTGNLVRLNSVRNFQWSGSYRVADESLPDDLLYDNFEDTAGRGEPWKSMRAEIRPAFGDTFVYGSTVISRAQVTGTFATHDRFLDGFYVIGPTKLFVFRASYGDADPKRLTDV